mmetsp:Transcript_55151/g.155188  ORF Transcript_55151/g.155188 Transcript_55151/m.155188 type:complete len:370 (+) Transcript_55151:688-1797(+)
MRPCLQIDVLVRVEAHRGVGVAVVLDQGVVEGGMFREACPPLDLLCQARVHGPETLRRDAVVRRRSDDGDAARLAGLDQHITLSTFAHIQPPNRLEELFEWIVVVVHSERAELVHLASRCGPRVVPFVHAEEHRAVLGVIDELVREVLLGVQPLQAVHALWRGWPQLAEPPSRRLEKGPVVLVHRLGGGAANHVAHPGGQHVGVEGSGLDLVCVHPVGGQRHEEHRVGVQRDAELSLVGASRPLGDARFQVEAQLRQPARVLVAVVEGVLVQHPQLAEALVERTESHDPVPGHILGLVGVSLDLRLRLLLVLRGRRVVVDLRQDVVQGGLVLKHGSSLTVQRIDDTCVALPEVDRRAREVGGAAQQPEV